MLTRFGHYESRGRIATKYKLLLGIVLFGLGGLPCVAAGGAVAENRVLTASADGASADELRRHADEADRHAAILEAKAELTSDAEGRLDTIIAIFGVVIAVVAVIFGLSTRAIAIAEAKDGVEALRRDFEAQVERAKAEIKALEDQGAKARDIIERLAAGQVPKKAEDRETVKTAAQVALDKPPAQRTVDDFKTLIVSGSIAKDWQSVLDHAHALAYTFANEQEAKAYGLFYEALALGELDRNEEAETAYSELLSRFLDSGIQPVKDLVAAAIYNRGVILGRLGRLKEENDAYDDLIGREKGLGGLAFEQVLAQALFNKSRNLGDMVNPEAAIAGYDELLARFRDAQDRLLLEQVGRALVNKSAALSRLGRLDEAKASAGEVIERFAQVETPSFREVTTNAYYNRACAYALAGQTAEAIADLSEWRDRLGHLDRERLAGDKDFDLIREDPAFVDFLAAQDGDSDPAGTVH